MENIQQGFEHEQGNFFVTYYFRLETSLSKIFCVFKYAFFVSDGKTA